MNSEIYTYVLITLMSAATMIINNYNLIVRYKTSEFVPYVIIEILCFLTFMIYFSVTLQKYYYNKYVTLNTL